MAESADAQGTSDLVGSGAALLRHSLGQIDKNGSRRDEVGVVKEYFHIQKIRFSERSQFKLNVDESCLEIEIPRLTLQPLVENAFIHGIEEKEEGGIITLNIYQTETNVIVEVRSEERR